MTPSWAERQAALAAYLADPHTFGDSSAKALVAPDTGLDPARLQLVGSIALRKRAEKIKAAFPLTVRYLGDAFPALMRDFAHYYPPRALPVITHAEPFHAYLVTALQAGLAAPAFIGDLAALELAIVSVTCAEEMVPYLDQIRDIAGRRLRITCRYTVLLLSHDVRPLFDRSVQQNVAAREIHLLVVGATARKNLRIAEITPEMHAISVALKNPRNESRLTCSDEILDTLIGLEILQSTP